MSVVPQEYSAVDGGSGRFIKGSDFATENGMNLEVVSFEKQISNRAEFGAQPTDSLVKNGLLKEGEVFTYNFREKVNNDFGMGGSDKVFTSKSAVFFFSFRDAAPEVGDILNIKRTGSGKNTKYFINKVK